ncbi:MAG: hypothetical protein ABFD09_09100 [Proteiniphilum sp.]
MKRNFLLYFLLLLAPIVFAQTATVETDSAVTRLQRQLVAFPQEKIYVQTDKAGYLSGERIWFRAHMVDALTHRPIFKSRYIYVELIGPLDDLVKRVKVRPDSTGAYSGHVDLQDDLAQGTYTLRAYTQYMRNRDEEFFFRRPIQVLDPFSLQLEPVVTFDVEKNDLHLSMQFINRQQNDTVLPEMVTYKVGYNAIKTIKPKSDGVFHADIRLSEKDKNNTMLLGIIYKGRKYNRYYTVPGDRTAYDLQFFPEGGHIIPGFISQVAFKALNSNGMGADITGTLYDSADREILTFKSLHLGMGFFHFIPAENESYHVICRNEAGTFKRFDLPKPQPGTHTITARNTGGQIRISKSRGKDAAQDTVSLLIHHKGLVLFHERWDPNKEIYSFENKDLPTGILNILLLNARQEVLSERLLFNLNGNEAVLLQADTPEPAYKRREHITLALRLTDPDLTPSTGNIAVSVTDKGAVITDTTMNIISTLLLSSELKGYIESPASYFEEGKINKHALDALMLTQGWRRYDVPAVLQGRIATPNDFIPELAQKVTGKAESVLGALKEGQISLMARLDTLVSTQTTVADDRGRFAFDVEYPEGTAILVQSRSKKGGSFNVISLDQETFPALKGTTMPLRPEAVSSHKVDLDPYLQLANEDYTQKNGIRTILLDEFTVTAQNLEKYKESSFYSPISASGVQTAEDIEKMAVSSLRSLLQRQSGILIRGDVVTTTRSEMPVLFVIDDMKFEDFSGRLDDIDVSSIESLFVLKDNTSMPGYFPGTSGAVVITTKMGGYKDSPRRPPSIDDIIPLGYLQAARFYAPAYETPEQAESSMPDLRTTLFWRPNVQFSAQGEAAIDFYSADTPGIYQVIAEGVTSDGKMMRLVKEITVEDSTR